MGQSVPKERPNILVVGPIAGDVKGKLRDIVFPVLSPDPAQNKDVNFLNYPVYVGGNRGRGQVYPTGEKSNNNAYTSTVAGQITSIAPGEKKNTLDITIASEKGDVTQTISNFLQDSQPCRLSDCLQYHSWLLQLEKHNSRQLVCPGTGACAAERGALHRPPLHPNQSIQEGCLRLPVECAWGPHHAREEADSVCDEHADQGPGVHQKITFGPGYLSLSHFALISPFNTARHICPNMLPASFIYL